MRKAARIILGVLFLLSSISKLFSMEGFELYIFTFGAAGFDLCSYLARFIVASEFIIGLGLLSRISYKLFKYATALFLSVFSLFLLWRIAVGDSESCHCMGDIVDLNPLQSFIKNIFLALFLALAWRTEERQINHRKFWVCFSSFAIVAAVFIVVPPDAFYRIGRSSNDINIEEFTSVADSLGYSDGRRMVCLYSATCEHCRNSASKMAGIIRRHDIPVDSVSVIFMQTHHQQDSVSLDFFKRYGEGLELPSSYLHPYSFIPMTNGAMPLVVLFEDGVLVKEFDYFSIDEREIAAFWLR